MLASEVLEFILLVSQTVSFKVWGAVVRGAGIWVRSWVQHVGVKVLVWGCWSLDCSDFGC